jgi:hypothetical protein
MKISELFNSRVDILEALNSHLPINWSQSDYQHRGTFEANNETYTIHANEYDLNVNPSLHLIDVGFTIGSNDAKLTNKHSPSIILGTVIHGITYLNKQLNPDCIVFGAHYANGEVDKRMSLYERISSLWANPIGFIHVYPFETKNSQYRLISKIQLSDDQVNVIRNTLNSAADQKSI